MKYLNTKFKTKMETTVYTISDYQSGQYTVTWKDSTFTQKTTYTENDVHQNFQEGLWQIAPRSITQRDIYDLIEAALKQGCLIGREGTAFTKRKLIPEMYKTWKHNLR